MNIYFNKALNLTDTFIIQDEKKKKVYVGSFEPKLSAIIGKIFLCRLFIITNGIEKEIIKRYFIVK